MLIGFVMTFTFLSSDPVNLFINAHSHDEYVWVASLSEIFPLNIH